MTSHDHERAIDLATSRGVEGITDSEVSWLDAHLAECPGCSSYAVSLRSASQVLRSTPVMASRLLVMTTQNRLRARALEMRERESRMYLIGVSFCLGMLSSTASAWLWWKFGSWAVQLLGLPQAIVAPGVVLFWLLPAIAIAMLLTFVPRTLLNHPLMLSLTREREGGLR
jgi:hypothetical protein